MSEKKKSLSEFYETKVEEIMQTMKSDLPCIDENADISTVFIILSKTDHVWVVQSKNPAHLLGVITESDTISFLSPPLTSLQSFEKPDSRSLQYGIFPTAGEMMSIKPVTTAPKEKIRDVLRKMKEQKIKQLPVLDENERLIGEICLNHLIQKYLIHMVQNLVS